MAGEPQPEKIDTDRIDVCFKLAERARDRFTARQAFEWRYAFALWTLFAGGAAVIFTAGSFALSFWPAIGVSVANLVAASVMIVFYWAWLQHLDEESDNDRNEGIHYEDQIIRTANITRFQSTEAEDTKRSWLTRVLARVEIPWSERRSDRRAGHRVVVMHFWVAVVLALLFVASPWARHWTVPVPTEANVTIEQGNLKIEGGTTRIDLGELHK